MGSAKFCLSKGVFIFSSLEQHSERAIVIPLAAVSANDEVLRQSF